MVPDISIMCLVAAGALSAPPEPGYHPWTNMPKGSGEVDLSYEARERAATEEDDHDRQPTPTGLPEGWVQIGDQIVPTEIALGLKNVDPAPNHAWEDIPGNKYPRKHTVYLHFDGGMVYRGADNSAEDKSMMARQGEHPGCGCSSQTRAWVAQGIAQDVARYGIRVVYEDRPSKTVPYTMVLFGGNACDQTTMEDCHLYDGVAPSADCEAHGQRHVVFAFQNSANMASHELGHAWGLDHTDNCSALMSYCGGGDKVYSSSCDRLCEDACQGPGTISCRLVHEKHCGEGSDRQIDDDELGFVFGTNDPDIEAPLVEIHSPEDGREVEVGASVQLRAEVDDDYGGVGWKVVIEHDGEVVYDEVDYHKDNIDADAMVALNLTKLEAGTYRLTVEAEDHADHVTQETVTFTVSGEDDDDGDTTGEDESDTGDDGEGESGSGGGGEDETGSGDEGGTEDDAGNGDFDDGFGNDPRPSEEGCECSAAREPGRATGLWLLALVTFVVGRLRIWYTP